MGKILGIDFGETRIGLALSSDDGQFVFPFQTVQNVGSEESMAIIGGICKKEGVESIVVGLPLDQHGKMGEKATVVKEWADRLSHITGIRIDYEDERFTTALASSIKKQAGWSVKKTRQTIDQTAASMILQTFLDKRHG
jgi:putative Holliday junction resolvase